MVTIDRELLPPHDLEAEQACLGCCLIDSDAYALVAAKVGGADFYRERHRRIFEAMGALVERHERIDLLTLRAELERTNYLEEIGGPAYLAGLSADAVTSLHAEHYAAVIARTATLRRLIRASQRIASLAYDNPADAEAALAQADQALLEVRKGRPATNLITPLERAQRASEWLEALRQGVVPGIPYGLRDLDNLTGGAQPGELILVGGRPGDGKSTLLQTMASSMANAGNRVLYATIEMPCDEITKRELSWTARINLHRLRTGEFGEDEYSRLIDALGPLSEQPVYTYDAADMTTASLRAAATEQKLRHGLDVICLDYLQILTDQPHGSNDTGRITYISRRLMNLARALNVPLIAASQLSRKTEGREDRRPQLSDLRESGGLEQDAHVVLLIHRQRDKSRPKDSPDPTNLIVAKQRQGPTGNVPLVFIPKMTRFVDADRSGREEPGE